MPSEDKKRAFFLILIALVILALLITIFAPNALAQSDTGFAYANPQLQASIDQCNAQITQIRTQVDQTAKNCIVTTERTNRLADGFKNYVLAALAVSVAANAGLVYYLLRKKREATKQSTQGGTASD